VRLSWDDVKTHKLALFKNAISYMKEELANDKLIIAINKEENLSVMRSIKNE